MFDIKNILLPDIKEHIENKDFAGLKNFLKTLKSQDIADLISSPELEPEERAIIFRLLETDVGSEVFSELYPDEAEELINSLTKKELIDILKELEPDDRTRFFDELPAEVVKRLLLMLPREERDETLLLLNYPLDSVGHAMTPDALNLSEDMTVDQAVERIRSVADDVETVYDLFVVDNKNKLIGKVTLKSLVLSRGEKFVRDIMEKNPIYIKAMEDREKAAKLIEKYDLIALPVVDSELKFLGIITVDDVIDIMEKEATEDIYKMAAMEAPHLEEEYFRLNLFERVKKRVPWLIGLLLAEVLSSSVIKTFEHTLSAIVALAFFIPMLTDSGGNVGSQAVTLIVRAFAVGEIEYKKIIKVVIQELFTSFIISIPLGITAFLIAFFVSKSAPISLVVGLSLIAVVILSNLVGIMLPVLFRQIHIDPAVSSSPLITTIVDVLGLLTYLGLATMFILKHAPS